MAATTPQASPSDMFQHPNSLTGRHSVLPSRPRPTTRTRVANAPSSGSQTMTETPAQPRHPVLRLRAASHTTLQLQQGADDADDADAEGSTKRRIQWADDVVDNEGLGRKSSKVCCIYHGPRNIDSSSDESSSDSDDSDSESGDDGTARPVGGGKGTGKAQGQGHGSGDGCGHDHKKGKGKAKRSTSPNAYENVRHLKKGTRA